MYLCIFFITCPNTSPEKLNNVVLHDFIKFIFAIFLICCHTKFVLLYFLKNVLDLMSESESNVTINVLNSENPY